MHNASTIEVVSIASKVCWLISRMFLFLFDYLFSIPEAYSIADPRVKELAYAVKHWAKRRWVNNASEGTLSSYGYLLCLVHFLQTRTPPVVPNLQVGFW